MAFVYNVTFDCADPRRLAAFWAAVTGYTVTDEQDDFVRLRAPDSRGIRHILFFLVPEPKTSKSRVHIDLADPNPEAEVARLVALGATEVARHAGHGTAWVVMTDPEGNEFCIG